MTNAKVRVAFLSILSNTFLIILKLIIGIISGSVSIISEAIHSIMDLIAAMIAYFSVKISDNPPDSRHPYGHGKIENISGVIEALLIFVAATLIIIEAIKKLWKGVTELEWIWLGAIVMFISAIVNFFVSRKLYKVARQTNSIALEADALHLKTDIYTSLGVAVGLMLIYFTNIYWFDPVIAILVALMIFYESIKLLKKAFSPLLDAAWNEKDINKLTEKLSQLNAQYYNLKTRTAGNYKFAELHLEVNKDESVEKAHQRCDLIENELAKMFENLTVTIHIEPK